MAYIDWLERLFKSLFGVAMYTKDGQVKDRREMLKVKIKSLAAESQIIRHEENKVKGKLHNELHLHRVGVVRREARHSLIAYAIIRGKTPADTMQGVDEDKVNAMVKKFGPLAQSGRAAVFKTEDTGSNPVGTAEGEKKAA